MIKGINVFLVLMAIAITSTAEEKKIDTANIGQDLTSRVENNVVPPVVKEKYEYYEVCGICEKDVQCDLKKKCIKWSDGKKYDSVTDWKITWDYGHNHTPQTCTTNSFLVTVNILYQLPKWVSSGDAPRPLVEKWESFLKKLMIHEKGHRDRAVEAATELTNAIKELPLARTCAELDREVHALSRKSMIKLKKDQEEYDAVTNHGQTQGAVFP
jgi:predicted secreted Zn-dependent protease